MYYVLTTWAPQTKTHTTQTRGCAVGILDSNSIIVKHKRDKLRKQTNNQTNKPCQDSGDRHLLLISRLLNQ